MQPQPQRILRGRILNACTTKPRTRRELIELLQAPTNAVGHQLKDMYDKGILHVVGTQAQPKAKPAYLYSAAPLPVVRKPLPVLTVWRGPLPIEWRM